MKRKIRRTGEIISVAQLQEATMTEYSSMVIMGM